MLHSYQTLYSLVIGWCLLGPAGQSFAGLYYSAEQLRPLPAKWSGFLPDHRLLRQVGAPRRNASEPVPLLRGMYNDALLKLQTRKRQGSLSADELADLGALHLRLGEPIAALEVLRTAAREHPRHFRIQANLGTAWQLNGDLSQAAAALADALELAPKESQAAETLHLKLVRTRLKEGATREPLNPDPLFDDQTATAPKLALAQQLAIWLPADGRLLWLLGELAYQSGDVRTAANCLDGCVTELNMGAPLLREHRQLYRNKADELDRLEQFSPTSTIRFASSRALLRTVDPKQLPPIRPDGISTLPWPVVQETEIDPRGRATFMEYLEQLDGKRVSLSGHMTGISAGGDELAAFLITENPVGCWFCETPGPNQLIRIELPAQKTIEQTRALLKVMGILKLNKGDPERLPLTIIEARISQPD